MIAAAKAALEYSFFVWLFVLKVIFVLLFEAKEGLLCSLFRVKVIQFDVYVNGKKMIFYVLFLDEMVGLSGIVFGRLAHT